MVKTKSRNPKTDGETIDLHEAMEENPDLMSLRIVENDTDERTFRIEAHNPYALWKIIPSKGPAPKDLSGLYTSESDARAAIERYLNK